MEEIKYTYDDLLQAVSSLEDEKKTFLMQAVDMRHVLSMMNSDKAFEKTMKNIDTYIAYYQLMQAYLEDLRDCLEFGNYVTSSVISKDTILVCDFKRIVNSNPSLKVIDNLIGLSKYFDQAIQLGIGCNHKYEVES